MQDDVGIAGLRHFLFKSKAHIQFTMPSFGEPYINRPKEQKRFVFNARMINAKAVSNVPDGQEPDASALAAVEGGTVCRTDGNNVCLGMTVACERI
jgi:hypothetical protein